MIILDTNVISALMQQQPDPVVVAWLDDQSAESIWISSITLFEARYGIALLASGQRKINLHERFDQLLQEDLENRVLLFDTNAVDQAANLPLKEKSVAALWICATPSLPEPPWQSMPRWPRVICVILMTCPSPLFPWAGK